MDEQSPLLDLCLHLSILSMMAVGGGLVMMAPDISHFVVTEKHWVSSAQFASAYAIAQAAPGPNLLFISLVGWLIAGWTGAILTTLAVIIPSTILTLSVISLKASNFNNRLTAAVRDTFAPISIGFLLATAFLFTQVETASWGTDVVTVLTAIIVLRSKLNPVLLIAAGATAGMLHLI
ncbi:chromate transporter [Undibacterium sp. TS12]|uniref:chromate transporter n=1 Tax=Undibacterium sp. TS12 TaxID=2908202 RepID=UPI001F4D2CC7|nr:chromate transporter [Undibacterium sp. TS12]MCH8619524.1 chromate transporter [Undibacterium sp. TS12]